jgi:hypothetical protein
MRTDVSEDRITSIFWVENQASKNPTCSRWLGNSLQAGFLLDYVNLEDGNIHNYRCVNLKFYSTVLIQQVQSMGNKKAVV